jgi:hypothetical protein
MKGIVKGLFIPLGIACILVVAISYTKGTLIHHILLGTVCYFTGAYFTEHLFGE